MRTMLLALAIAIGGCARTTSPPPEYGSLPSPQLPPRAPFDPDAPARGTSTTTAFSSDALQAAPAVRAENYSVQTIAIGGASLSANRLLYGGRAARSDAPGAPAIDDVSDPMHGAKIEREAQLSIAVADVTAAADAAIAAAANLRGWIAKDERSTEGRASAELLVRVPAQELDVFVDYVARLGEVKVRRVRAIDATLEHKDIATLLANLEAAQAKYRDLLARATDAAQTLAIERELERVRTEIERIKARLDYLRDRVAFATVAVGFYAPLAERDVPGGYEPHITTGLRGLTLVDVRDSGTNAYLGAGLSIRFPRSMTDSGRGFVLDVDVMRACCKTSPARADAAFDVLTGFDLFSESLEGGRRRFFNPYVGVRAGVAETQDRVDFAAAAVVGLELVKTRAVVVDLQTRVMALVGNPDGPHGAVQPSVGVDVGF